LKKGVCRRTRKLFKFDKKLRESLGDSGILCGVDEAGRGPLAGPVVAAAVIFADDVYIKGIYDSKQLTHEQREELYEQIVESASSYSVGIVDNNIIDEINILQATKRAMDTAVAKLKIAPGLVIADGNFYSNSTARVENFVQGDAKSFSIAAASIIAKVTRDRIMVQYENEFPNFTFSSHKGYATQRHIDEIFDFGYTAIHRRSFKLKMLQGELF
jgi:ribonuclease HII